MDVYFGYSKYMPSPYSVYISNFSDDLLTFLKNAKPFARYNKEDHDYEITPELYEQIKTTPEHIVEHNSVPPNLGAEFFSYKTDYPFQYQDNAIAFLQDKNKGLLNFTQGAGKSFTTMRILAAKGSKRNLIITGVSNLQEEWLKDAYKHKRPDGTPYAEFLNMRIVATDPAAPVKKRVQYLREAHKEEDCFTDLLGIESCRNEELIAALNDLHYDSIVVDEVQAAKGMTAEQTMGIHELVKYPDQFRLALSGTPVLNDPLEYYSLLRFLGIFYYRNQIDQCSRSAFNKYYGEWGFDYWGHYVCKGYKNIPQLKQLLSPVILTVPKAALGLPPKERNIIHLPITTEEYKKKSLLYKKGSKAVKKAGYPTIQALASELQVMTSTSEEKIQFILSSVSKQERPLVFSQYTTVLDIVKERLEKQGLTVLYYHGKLSSKERLSVLEQWKSGQGDVLLLSISCSRYGLNLQETQVAIFLEPPTSPAILEQAEDRLHRIGQTKTVRSYLLISGESDDSDLQTIQRKQDILTF